MKIKLIKVAPKANWNVLLPGRYAAYPPVSLGAAAALTPPDIEVIVVDPDVGQKIGYEEDVDLVALSTITCSAPRAYSIADRFRARGIPVVIGGCHPTVLPEEAALHADSVCIGEAEGYWGKLIADFRKGELNRYYRCEKPVNPDDWARPDHSIYASSRYLELAVQASRGCPHSCSFCTIADQHQGRFRYRSVDDIVDEIASLGNHKLISFVDDNLLGNVDWARQLFTALVPLDIRWVSQMPVTVALDRELLQLVARSGCRGMFIGFETINTENMREIGTPSKSPILHEEAIKQIHDLGIMITAGIVIGFEHDDVSTFDRTLDFCVRNRFESTSFSILTPFPGTRLFRRLDSSGRIIDRDWAHYDMSHVVFAPARMAPETLQEGYWRLWKEFYSFPSILQRLSPKEVVVPRNMPFAWAHNIFIRGSWSQHR